MPSAGAIQPPRVMVLRDPRVSIPSNKIDSETFIELVTATPNTKIYFTTDGTKPNPFQIGVAGRESTFKYKAAFQLMEGKRTIKALAISRDGLQESAVMSKTFQVEAPIEDFDDGYSFIDSFDSMSTSSMSTSTASTASTVKHNKRNKYYNDRTNQENCSNYESDESPDSSQSEHSYYTRLYHEMVKKDKKKQQKKKEKRYRSRSRTPPREYRQAWSGDVRASQQMMPNGSFVPWGEPAAPVTAGTVFYPSVNSRTFSPEPDMGFLTKQMMQKLEQQRMVTVAEVKEAVREMASPRQPPAPPAVEYMPPRFPEPKACSPGNGNWREQLEHVYAHLIEHAQVDPDFRIALGEPKLGRIIEADFVDGDDDTLVMTVAISRYGHTRKPKPRPKIQAAPKVVKAFSKPPPPKAPTPQPSRRPSVKPPSKPPSVKPVPPTPPPEPEPVPEKDPDPYFVTEDYEQEGTLKPHPGFDAENDSETLRKAMKGLGTNEDAITNVLGARSATQRVDIVKTFKTMFGKDLIAELKSELSGNYLSVCKGLCLPPADFDAHALHKAMKGLGTDEQGLVEVICTRTNAQITAFKEAYKRLYNKELEKAVEDDTSGHFKRMLVSLLQANRDESPTFDQTKVEQDAQKLFDAGEQKKFGTDESRFNVILVSRSYPHLRAVFEAYQNIANKDIEESLKSEMSGDLLKGMLGIVRCIRHKPSYFAKTLYKSMKGLGTDDESLLRVVISRCEIDMVQIKQAFQTEYKQTLGQFIVGDTSGDFRKILLMLVGEQGAGKK